MNWRIPGSLAVAVASAFAGAATYIGLAEQPARLLLDDRNLLLEWQASYPVGIRMQGTLAIVAGLAGMWAWWLSRDWRWLAGAVIILANWPYTLLALQAVNAELAATALESASSRSRILMEQWGLLHAVRSGLGLLATIVFLWALRPRAGNAIA